jgi:hypothetical protein
MIQDPKKHAELRDVVWFNLTRGEFIHGSRCENVINGCGVTGMHGAAFLDELLPWLQATPTVPAGSYWRGRWRGDRVVATDVKDSRLKPPSIPHPTIPGAELIVKPRGWQEPKNVSDEVAYAWTKDFATPWQDPNFGGKEVAA